MFELRLCGDCFEPLTDANRYSDYTCRTCADELGLEPNGPCRKFAGDTLGPDPDVCTTCFYHHADHAGSG